MKVFDGVLFMREKQRIYQPEGVSYEAYIHAAHLFVVLERDQSDKRNFSTKIQEWESLIAIRSALLTHISEGTLPPETLEEVYESTGADAKVDQPGDIYYIDPDNQQGGWRE